VSSWSDGPESLLHSSVDLTAIPLFKGKHRYSEWALEIERTEKVDSPLPVGMPVMGLLEKDEERDGIRGLKMRVVGRQARSCLLPGNSKTECPMRTETLWNNAHLSRSRCCSNLSGYTGRAGVEGWIVSQTERV